MRAVLAVGVLLVTLTNTQRIAALEKWEAAHKTEHAAGVIHKHVTTAPVTSLDTRTQGWSKFVPVYGVGDPGFGLDSDFLGSTAQVTYNADGSITITAERKPTPSGRAYASACIGTKGTFAQLYGTFAARIRMPAGNGVFPAWWALSTTWPTTPRPEVDMMEYLPGAFGNGPNVLATTNHVTGIDPSDYFLTDRGFSWAGAFHDYVLTWSAGLMVFTVDGIEAGRITKNVPNVAMFPIVNLALGTGKSYRVDASTPAVLTMDVAYVAVTQ